MSNENETESAHEVVIKYRVNKTSQSEVNKKFLVEFKNNLQTEWRKCIKCYALVNAPNMGTSSMHKHLLPCSEAPLKRPLQQGQSTLKYQKVPKQALPKGLDIATKLIYQDQILIFCGKKRGLVVYVQRAEVDLVQRAETR